MIKIEEFLEKVNNEEKRGIYAIVSYDRKSLAVYFSYIELDSGPYYFESLCELLVRAEGKEACEELKQEILNDKDGFYGVNIKNISQINYCIINDVMYEVLNWRCAPFLPKEVNSIRLCTNKDCTIHIINERKNKK